MSEHFNWHGRCGECGTPWPCDVGSGRAEAVYRAALKWGGARRRCEDEWAEPLSHDVDRLTLAEDFRAAEAELFALVDPDEADRGSEA